MYDNAQVASYKQNDLPVLGRKRAARSRSVGQQQEQAEDRDAHGETEEQVPQDLSLEIVRRLRCVYSLHQK